MAGPDLAAALGASPAAEWDVGPEHAYEVNANAKPMSPPGGGYRSRDVKRGTLRDVWCREPRPEGCQGPGEDKSLSPGNPGNRTLRIGDGSLTAHHAGAPHPRRPGAGPIQAALQLGISGRSGAISNRTEGGDLARLTEHLVNFARV